jgi:nucleoside phosphorylase
MRILVTFAVEAEFAPWAKLRPFRGIQVAAERRSGGLEVFEAGIADHTVWVYLTGIGRRTFSPLACCAEQASADVVISSGLAGSLKREHRVGEVVAPRKIGTLQDGEGVPASRELLRLAKAHGAKLVETMLSADHIVESSEEKSRLAGLADVVDMESHHDSLRAISRRRSSAPSATGVTRICRSISAAALRKREK